MKLETKQTEVRLVAENDLEKFYLENFFTDGTLIAVEKEEGFDGDTVAVTLSYENV